MKINNQYNNLKLEKKAEVSSKPITSQINQSHENNQTAPISINKNVLSQLVSFKSSKFDKSTPEGLSSYFAQSKFFGYNDKILAKTKLYEFEINLNHPKIKEIFKELKPKLDSIKSNEAKINLIQKYVDTVFSKFNDKDSLRICHKEHEDFYATGRKSLDFGDVVEKGAGVCRHRAILFKLICDYLLDSNDKHRPRATLTEGYKKGYHAWNTVKFFDNNGKATSNIVDYTNTIPIDNYTCDNSNYDKAISYTTIRSKEREVLQPYYNGKKDFSNKTLVEEDFSCKTLNRKMFMESAIDNTNFKKTTLEHCKFHNATINNCNFDKATFYLTTLKFASLKNCTMKKAILNNSYFKDLNAKNVDFSNSTFNQNDFSNSSLKNCQLNSTQINTTNFKDSLIENSSFFSASLAGDFTSARIKDCDFKNSYLLSSTFKDTVISSSNFDNCIISKNAYTSNSYFTNNYSYLEAKDLSAEERKKDIVPEYIGIGILKPKTSNND